MSDLGELPLELEAGITKYRFVDGVEIREYAFPEARRRWMIVKLAESMGEAAKHFQSMLAPAMQNMAKSFEGFGESMRKADIDNERFGGLDD